MEPVVAVLANGLGNQMSCIAGAIEYASDPRRAGRPIKLDGHGLWGGKNKHEENPPEAAALKFWPDLPRLERRQGKSVSEYAHEHFLPHFKALNIFWETQRRNKNVTILYKGYSYHHFASENVLKDVVTRYAIVPSPSKSIYELTAGNIRDLDNAFFIHIRRGDFKNVWNRRIFGIDLHKQYYPKALAKFAGYLHAGARVLVCSDDIPWCKKNLVRLYPQVPVAAWTYCNAARADDTLVFMASCKLGGITANSSLSWWGMVLGSYKFHTEKRLYITPKNFIRVAWPLQSATKSRVLLPHGVVSIETGDLYMDDVFVIFVAALLVVYLVIYRITKLANK